MPHKVYQCDYCDFTHKKKKKVKQHEKECLFYETYQRCNTCRGLNFWWGSFSCQNTESGYFEKVIPYDSVEGHSCVSWKRKK